LRLEHELANVEENDEAVDEISAQEEVDVQEEGLNGNVEEEADVFFVVCDEQNVLGVSQLFTEVTSQQHQDDRDGKASSYFKDCAEVEFLQQEEAEVLHPSMWIDVHIQACEEDFHFLPRLT